MCIATLLTRMSFSFGFAGDAGDDADDLPHAAPGASHDAGVSGDTRPVREHALKDMVGKQEACPDPCPLRQHVCCSGVLNLFGPRPRDLSEGQAMHDICNPDPSPADKDQSSKPYLIASATAPSG